MSTKKSDGKNTSFQVTPQCGGKQNESSSSISTNKMDGKIADEASNNIISLLEEEEERQLTEAKKRSLWDIFSGPSPGKKKAKTEPEIISILSDDDSDDTDDGGDKPSACSSTSTIELLYSTRGGDDNDVIIVDASEAMEEIIFQNDCTATLAINGDIMEVGTKNAMNLPHMRQHCTKISFIEDYTSSIDTTKNSKFCEKCYCYVCDVPAGECENWLKHCHASDKGKHAKKWKKLRRNKKNPNANLQNFYKSLDRHQHLLSSWHENSTGSAPLRKLLYKPNEITEAQATQIYGLRLVQCRICKWWTRLNNNCSNSIDNPIKEWCRACGRVASESYFNRNQSMPYITKAGDISLGTKKIPFRIKARDPRQIEPYNKRWQQYEGEDGWIYSEKEMKHDFFKHRIGENPQIKSLLFCMPVLKESKIPIKAKVKYRDSISYNAMDAENVSLALETEALIISDRNDRAIIQELNEHECACSHSIVLSTIRAEYNKETQTGNISITLTLSPQSFRGFRKRDYHFAQLLGAWYSVFPFKLSELTVGLAAGRNKTQEENAKLLQHITSLIPTKLTPSKQANLETELDEGKNQSLIKYKMEAAAIESSLSFKSSSGKQRNGGISENDVSFKGTLRRYFRETLPDDFNNLACNNRYGSDCCYSPAGHAIGIVSTHRSMNGSMSACSLHPTYGLKSYLDTTDLDICLRYLNVQLQKKRNDGMGINGLLTQLENLHHEPVGHVEGLSETLQLLDFQRQAVGWAYEQEQVEGGIQSFLWTKLPSALHHVTATKAVPIDVYYSPILDKFSTEKPAVVRGGIIAEQMGLGKTVISLALILKNPAPSMFSGVVERNPNIETQSRDNNVNQTGLVQQPQIGVDHIEEEKKPIHSTHKNVDVLPQFNMNRAKYLSNGTLVVCNVSLVGQWIDEAKSKLRDPGLVYSYHGSNRKRCSEILAKNSIVVTTYATLASDDTFWRSKSNDPANYCPPCEQIKWWRIICDESHALKSQDTSQYRALSNIKAVNKWCVTGTPMNTTVSDLKGQLSFLGLQDVSAMFGNLIEDMPSHAYSSKRRSYRTDSVGRCLFLLRNIMIRHAIQMTSRSEARSLMSLPPKEEKIITISFTNKEREEYNKLEKKAQEVYLQMKFADPSLISKNILKISSALLPLRVACSGGQVEEAKSKGKSIISTIPMDMERNADDILECPICLGQIENARATRCKPVAHVFCKECIEGYFDGSNTIDCPSCRTCIKVKELCPVNITEPCTSNAETTKHEKKTSEDNVNSSKKKVNIYDIIFKSKFERLLVELKHIRDNEPESKTLVFSQFFSSLQWMKQELPKHGFQFRTLSGNMPMTQRAKALRDFQNDPPTTIFLLSLRSGAVGINLTQANRVFLMEPAVNPALEAQAVGRVYRLGQRKTVQVIRMQVEDTIESRMVDVLAKKYGASTKPAPEESEGSSPTSTSTPEEKVTTVTIPAVGHLTTDKAPSLLMDEFDALFGV